MNGGRAFPHRFSHACQLLDRFAFGRQSTEGRRYLRICGKWIQQSVEKIRCFGSRKIFSAHKTHRRLAKVEITGFPYCRLQIHRIPI
jgi:hypothetical protein